MSTQAATLDRVLLPAQLPRHRAAPCCRPPLCGVAPPLPQRRPLPGLGSRPTGQSIFPACRFEVLSREEAAPEVGEPAKVRCLRLHRSGLFLCCRAAGPPLPPPLLMFRSAPHPVHCKPYPASPAFCAPIRPGCMLALQVITKQDAKVGLASAEEVGQAAPATPDRSCECSGWAERADCLLARCTC